MERKSILIKLPFPEHMSRNQNKVQSPADTDLVRKAVIFCPKRQSMFHVYISFTTMSMFLQRAQGVKRLSQQFKQASKFCIKMSWIFNLETDRLD